MRCTSFFTILIQSQVINKRGRLYGHYQGGEGLVESVRARYDFKGKKIVILGAGVVVRGFLYAISRRGGKLPEIEIYNRTVKNAEKVGAEFPNLNIKVGNIKDLKDAEGDIFINATYIGSPWNQGNDYKFTEDFVKRYSFVADVTFVPLKSQLIQVAEKVGVKNSPGWRMFLYQGRICLEKILGIKVDLNILGNFIRKDFRTNWS